MLPQSSVNGWAGDILHIIRDRVVESDRSGMWHLGESKWKVNEANGSKSD
jgi:hypothetical protein